MRIMGKKILVTGAAGLIGSHLTEYLVEQGCNIRASVQYNSFCSWGGLDHSTCELRSDLDVFIGDIYEPYGLRVATRNCDMVMHLSTFIGIPYSYHSLGPYVDTNINGILNIV